MSSSVKVLNFLEIISNTVLLVLDALVFYIIKLMIDTEIQLSQMILLIVCYIFMYGMTSLAYKVVYSKRNALFIQTEKTKVLEGVLKLNANQFYSKPNTEYVSTIQNDVETIKEEYYESSILLIMLFVKLFAYVMIVGYIDIRLVLLLVITVAFSFFIRNIGGVDLERAVLNRKEKRENFDHIVRNIYDCRLAINKETIENIEKFYDTYLDDLCDSQVYFGKRKSLLVLLNNCKLTVSNCLTVLILVLMCSKSLMTLGTAVLLYKYIDELMYVLLDMSTCHGLIKGTKELYLKMQFKEGKYISSFNQSIKNIQLKNVKAKYLDNEYNLSFNQGSTYFIQGDIGIGKSTLFRIIRNQIPFSGEYLVNGEKVVDSLNLENEIIMMSQVIPMMNLSFRELIERYFNLTLDTISKFVSDNKLNDFDTIMNCDNCSLLSSGERQKLCIVLLVLSNYSVKLYDEPTANIDIEHKQKYLNLIVADTDAMNLVIAHDMKKEMMEVLEIIIL